MTLPRLLAGVLFAVGLVAGHLADDDEVRSPRNVDGFWILAADFHVHAFPGDGLLTPWDLAREARRRNLDVIAITNHNQMIAAHLETWWPSTTGVMVLPSEEVTAPTFHMTAIGIDHAVDWRGSLSETAAAIHDQGGAAILAHPAHCFPAAFDLAGFAAIDGIEVAHPMMELGERYRQDLAEAYARAQTANAHVAAIGATDFHHLAALGLDRTLVFAREITPTAVVEAIRAGRTVACDQSGATYGPAVLKSIVTNDCRAAASARLTRSAMDVISLLFVWLGLVGLVVFGRR